MHKSEINNLILQVNEIAIDAGKAIMEIYNNEEDFGVEHKVDTSPLTVADKKANEIICKGLENLSTILPIISEENKTVIYDKRKMYEYFWVVDPLDGTKEFIKRNGEFTVNIALIHKDSPVGGVVYVPATEILFYASSGNGAYKQDGLQIERLSCKPYSEKDAGLVVVCSRSHINDETKAFISKFTDHQTVAKGSSLKFLTIASNEAHVYPRLGPTMEWDTAAAHSILQEAGGKIINIESNKSLKYNKESLLNPFFIAYGNRTSD